MWEDATKPLAGDAEVNLVQQTPLLAEIRVLFTVQAQTSPAHAKPNRISGNISKK